MKHMYSDLLVAYLFDEIDPDDKLVLEKELASNKELEAEFEELRTSLEVIRKEVPLSPNPKTIQHILKETKDSEAIPAD